MSQVTIADAVRKSETGTAQPDNPNPDTSSSVDSSEPAVRGVDNIANRTLDYEIKGGTEKNNTPLSEVLPIAKAVGGFDLDPCASTDSYLARENIRHHGGLVVDWGQYEIVFVNHPFDRGETKKWHRKAYHSDADLVIVLSRGSASADWFQTWVPKADLICLPDSRVKFVGHDNDAGFPIIYTVYGEYPAALRTTLEKKGLVIPGIGQIAQYADAYNEITVGDTPNQASSNPDRLLLSKISGHDTCEVWLSEPTAINATSRRSLELYPVCHATVADPDPTPTVVENVDSKANSKEYNELTCIHYEQDGSETWVVLVQSLENPTDIWCYANEGRDWIELDVSRVECNAEFRETLPPSSQMFTR